MEVLASFLLGVLIAMLVVWAFYGLGYLIGMLIGKVRK